MENISKRLESLKETFLKEVSKIQEDLVTETEFGDAWYESSRGSLCHAKHGCGISTNGKWIDHVSWLDPKFADMNNGFYPPKRADVKKLEPALKAEAAKRGFKEGVKYTDVDVDRTEEIKGALMYFDSTDLLTDGHGGAVYHRGKWAEIIKEPTVAGDKVEYDHEAVLLQERYVHRVEIETFSRLADNSPDIETLRKELKNVLENWPK